MYRSLYHAIHHSICRTRYHPGLLLIHVMSASAYGQGSLTIEQLLVDTHRWQMYSSYHLRSSSAHDGGVVQEFGRWTAGMRYGLLPRLEVSAAVSGDEVSAASGDDLIVRRAQLMTVGANWMVRPEGRRPAVLLEGNLEVLSGHDSDMGSLSAGQGAITVYRTLDPLVLSGTFSVRHESAYEQGRVLFDARTSWAARSQVSFAVNPRVTLFGGIGTAQVRGFRIDDQRLTLDQQSVSLSAGFAFSPHPAHTVFVSGDSDSSTSGAGLTVQWFFQF